MIIGFVALSAIGNSFIRDGVITWLPTILKTDFGFGDSSAVLITMGLSLLSCAGILRHEFFRVFCKADLPQYP